MPVRDLGALFRPSALALVIADGQRPGPLHLLVRNLFDAGLSGPILPVSARMRAIEGVLAYPSLAEVPIRPDLVVALAPGHGLPDILRAAAARGARALLALSAGDDAGPPPDGIGRLARRLGVRLFGPDALGVVTPAHGLNAGLAPVPVPPGRLALLSQSGSVAAAVLDWAHGQGIGFSCVAAGGAMADVDLADLLDFVALDSASRAILLHVERIGDAARFVSAARAAARAKPVIVLRPGRRDAADRAWDAVLRRTGALRVRELEEMFAAAETLALARPVFGERLFVLGNGAGLAELAAAALAEAGLTPARPGKAPRLAPMNLGLDAGGVRYAKAIAALADDPAGDAILVMHGPAPLANPGEVAEAVAGAARSGRRCVLTCWPGGSSQQGARALLAERGLPHYDTPAQAVRGFMHALEYRRSQQALAQTPPSVPEDFAPNAEGVRAVVAAALAAGRTRLDPGETEAVAHGYGLRALPDLCIEVTEDDCFGPVLQAWRPAAPDRPATALPPLDMLLAGRALDPLGGGDAAEALALIKVAQLAIDVPELVALRLTPDGAAIDLRPRPAPRRRLAIRPYPKHLEKPLPLPDGRALLVRPVLPEDEPRLAELFHRMSPEAVRLRFFAPKRQLGHEMGARLTQLDYAREMAFVVANQGRPGEAALHGIAHLTADPDGDRAEFAIMVAGDMVGLGLGPVLMRRLLDHAAAEGLREVYGEVLRENKQMLKLCRALGFEQSVSPEDREILHVSLQLGLDAAPAIAQRRNLQTAGAMA